MKQLKPAQAVWLAWRQGPSATWSLGHVAKDHYQTLCGKPIPMNAGAAPNAITKCPECRKLENKQNAVQTLVDVFGSENVIRPETHPDLVVKSEDTDDPKFTPGEWTMNPGRYDSYVISRVNERGTRDDIATVHDFNRTDREEEVRANVCLFFAARELYMTGMDALQELERAYGFIEQIYTGPNPIDEHCVAALRNALNHARGD